ncbi:hypothetical protein L6259_00765 [Candidatus Parcubacteria bacterium]|nr:hypothetical protein [Patescibacteria group bacterium]MCG2693804.1 hypothetical protein [Candidatus Parcubacteria bacterium]
MKKFATGLRPVDYYKSGIILLILGLLAVITKIISYLTDWFFIPNTALYFGIALSIISLYLIFVVPKQYE